MSVSSLANKSIVIQRATKTAGSFGGTEEAWAYHLKVRARVQPLTGREQEQYSRELNRVTHKFYVPGAPDILPSDRILFNGNTYQIRSSMDIDHLGRFTTIEAELQT